MNLEYSLLVGGPMERNVISVDIQDRWGRNNLNAADEFRYNRSFCEGKKK